MITTWGHDPGIVPLSNVLLALNDALAHSAVLVQVRPQAPSPWDRGWFVTSLERRSDVILFQ